MLLICCNTSFLLEGFRDFQVPTAFSLRFSKVHPKGEDTNLTCPIICLRLEGSIFSPVRYSYLSFHIIYVPR